jgi:hypothetical protein
MRMQVLKAAFHTKIGLLLMAVSHFSPTTAATEAFICLSAAIANDDNITTILGYTNSIVDHADHAIVTTCCDKVVACAHAVQAKLVSCSVALVPCLSHPSFLTHNQLSLHLPL